MKNSQENVLDKPDSEESYLLIGSSFGSGAALPMPGRLPESRIRSAPAGQLPMSQTNSLRMWVGKELAATSRAEDFVFRLLLASGGVLIVISFWL
jgi:hypothetical protein